VSTTVPRNFTVYQADKVYVAASDNGNGHNVSVGLRNISEDRRKYESRCRDDKTYDLRSNSNHPPKLVPPGSLYA